MILWLGPGGEMEFLYLPGTWTSVGAKIRHRPKRRGGGGLSCSVTVWWGPPDKAPGRAVVRQFEREPKYAVRPPFRCPRCFRRLVVRGSGLLDA